MSPENRRSNIALEQERWEGCLRSAKTLLSAGEYPDAVSRSYYAMLHASRALLLTQGLEARTHEGVSHLLYLHFVRAGTMEPEMARELRRGQVEREDADYDRAALFGEDGARQAVERAERFCAQCRALIARADLGG